MEKSAKIFIAGHKGLVGGAVYRRLAEQGYANIITRAHSELDLSRQDEVERFFNSEKPEYVFLAAAKVGGIGANSTYPADFIYQNTMIAANIIHSAYIVGTRKLLNLGSSCIYPKMAPQPICEDALLGGPLEPTNEAYAIAKIAAIKMCRYYNQQYGTNFLSAMPTNLYGPGDNYDLDNSHVLPALIRKFHEAKKEKTEVTLWGDGSPFREFLYSDDLADAMIFLMEKKDYVDIGEFVNVGSGVEVRISELAEMIAQVVGYEGPVNWDKTKPNGTPRKLCDVGRMRALGWQAKTNLREGILLAYQDYLRRYVVKS